MAENLIWEALVDVLGYAPATRQEEKLFGKVVSELRHANATPEEVQFFARRWRQVYPRAEMTATAIPKHWSSMVRKSDAPKPEAVKERAIRWIERCAFGYPSVDEALEALRDAVPVADGDVDVFKARIALQLAQEVA